MNENEKAAIWQIVIWSKWNKAKRFDEYILWYHTNPWYRVNKIKVSSYFSFTSWVAKIKKREHTEWTFIRMNTFVSFWIALFCIIVQRYICKVFIVPVDSEIVCFVLSFLCCSCCFSEFLFSFYQKNFNDVGHTHTCIWKRLLTFFFVIILLLHNGCHSSNGNTKLDTFMLLFLNL